MFGFGSTNTPPGQQQQQQPNQQSLFGSQTSSTPTFSFGNNAQQQSQQQPGGFGFGSSQLQAQNPSLGFGSSMNQPTQNTFASTQNPTANQPTNEINIDRTTRYTELSKEHQNALDSLDKEFSAQMQTAEENQAKLPQIAEMTQSVPVDVEEVTKRLSRVLTALSSDQVALTRLRDLVDKDMSRLTVSSKMIDVMRTPGAVLPRYANDPILALIMEISNEAEDTMNVYAKSIKEMESYLGDIEQHAYETKNPEALTKALESHHRLFLTLSNRVAEVHDEVKRIQSATRK